MNSIHFLKNETKKLKRKYAYNTNCKIHLRTKLLITKGNRSKYLN